MKKIGFIGLGTMGQPMAANLIKKGYTLNVYNRTNSRVNELIELGAIAHASAAEVVKSSEVVITMLSDDSSIENVYFGANGIMDGLHPAVTVIDCSTISPGLSIRLHIELASHGIDFLDAPVSGSKPAAIDGSLVFMIGGEQTILDDHRDLFLAMGKDAIYMGGPGSGGYTKIAANTIVGINVLGLCEGLAIASKSGIDPEAFMKVVLAGGASSRMAEMKGEKILSRDFSNQFSLQLMYKDLQIASKLADEYQLPLPILQNGKNVYQTAMLKEVGAMDLSSVVMTYEDLMNAKITKRFDPEQPETNRRRAPRIRMGIDVQISIHQYTAEGAFVGQTVEGKFFDLSAGGMMITSATPLAQDMFIVLHFPYEAELPPLIGRIIRVENDEAGYKYGCLLSGAAIHVRQKLTAYLESRTTAEASV